MTKEDLIKSLKNANKAPFLFLGSGFARHYIGTPTWEDLLEKFSSKPLNQYKSMLNTTSLPRIAAEISKDLTKDFWELPNDDNFFLKYKNEVGNQSSILKIKIANFLKEMSLKEFPHSYDEELKLLANLNIDGIITTNWDDTIERIFPKYKTFIGQKELLCSSIFCVGEIYKIHGTFRDPESMVLTVDDYSDFKEKYPYLVAKLITIFVEHPVVFIGYSMSDPNIQDILRFVVKCLDEKSFKKIQANLIFVEWEPGMDDVMVEKYIISMKDNTPLPVIRIQTGKFKLVYEILGYYERKIPADVLREYKKQFYDIVVSEKPERKIYALSDTKVDMDSEIQVVYGFGAIGKYMSANGYIGLGPVDIMRDVVRDENAYDALNVLTKSIPWIIKRSPTIYIPIYKYLSSVGIKNDNDYKNSPLKLTYSLRKGCDFCAYESFTNKDKNMSFADAIKTYTGNDTWKAVALIPFLRLKQEDLPNVSLFINENMNDFLVKSNTYSTFMRKLICFYDWKKYGW